MSDYKAKIHQIRLLLGLRPRSRWGAYSAPPDPLAEGHLLRGGMRKWEGGGKVGKGNGRRGEAGYRRAPPFRVVYMRYRVPDWSEHISDLAATTCLSYDSRQVAYTKISVC